MVGVGGWLVETSLFPSWQTDRDLGTHQRQKVVFNFYLQLFFEVGQWRRELAGLFDRRHPMARWTNVGGFENVAYI